MKYLLVLATHEIESWGGVLSRSLKKADPATEIITLGSVEGAVILLNREKDTFREIISGSFSQGDLNGPWRQVHKVAPEVKFSLLTSTEYDDKTIDALRTDGIEILDKVTFDRKTFIEARSSRSGRNPEIE